jgi:hypothetical protein
MTKYTGNEHTLHNHNKSQMTADYQPTTVKLHPLKKTTVTNMKSNIRKNKSDSEKRESNGRNEQEHDSRENVGLSHMYRDYHKRFYIKYHKIKRITYECVLKNFV